MWEDTVAGLHAVTTFQWHYSQSTVFGCKTLVASTLLHILLNNILQTLLQFLRNMRVKDSMPDSQAVMWWLTLNDKQPLS